MWSTPEDQVKKEIELRSNSSLSAGLLLPLPFWASVADNEIVQKIWHLSEHRPNPCGNCVHESLSLLCPTSLWTLNHVSMPALQTIMLQCPYSIPLTVGSSLKVSMLFSSSLSHCWICCFWQLSLGLRIFFKLKPKSEHLEPTHCVCNSAQSTRRLLYVSIRHLWMVLSYHCVAMIRSNNQKSH
jgi:hypothetical protein